MPNSFEETDAWKTARNLSKEIYSVCRREPLCLDFGLCDQLRRAAVSVMNNIAEGWESIHSAEKRQAYNYARRSCGELRSMTYALLDNQFINENDQKSLMELCIKAGQLVSGLIRSLDKR
jgi:four helix bundle protein